MIAQRTMTTANSTQNTSPAVQEALRLLAAKTPVYRWVCEECGMIHSGTAPQACDSCGSSRSLARLHEFSMEMGSRH